MQPCGWYGTLLRIILLLILLALPSESGEGCPMPPPLPHGHVVSAGGYETGALVIYVCDNGDRSSAKCTELGTWYPAPPQCTAVKTGDCKWQDLEDYITHTEGDYNALPGKVDFREGETAPYKCMGGYVPTSGSAVRDYATCRNSQWERPQHSVLTCRPRNCGHPTRGVFRNGHLNDFDFTFPHEVTFTCNPGFRLVTYDDQPWDSSIHKLYCQADGKWNTPAPKCVEVVCSQPSPISNGNITVPPGILKENATVQYVCNQGYVLVGPAERRCTNQAKWEGDDPTCERRCKVPPATLHGRIIGDKIFKFGATIIYDCDDGTKTTLKCIQPGRWDPDPPTCSPKTMPATPKSSSTTSTTTLPPPSQCSPLSSPTNGKLFSVEGFGVNASVIFSCNEGYTLRGSATLVCRPTGAWDPPTMPTCTAPPPWIIILSVCLAVLASLVICCLGFFYIMRRKRRSTPPPRAYRRQIRKPGPYDAMSNDEVARLGKPFPVTSL